MNKYVIFSIIVIIAVLLLYLIKALCRLTNHQPFSDVWNETNYKGETYKNIALNILESSSNIMKKIDVNIIPMYGSLLGIIRHGGFIPWDDDIDVTVPKDKFKYILGMEKQFNENNIGITVVNFGIMKFIKLYALNEPKINGCNWSWPFIDVFGYTIDNNNNVIIEDCSSPFKYKFENSEIFPLKSSMFEHVKVLIPNNATNVLDKLYKKDWKDICISASYNHRKEHMFGKTYKADCNTLKDKDINDILNNTWVINLRSRTDRWKTSQQRLNEIGIQPKRWDATDSTDKEYLKFYDNIKGLKRSKGELACYKSHFLLWKHLYDNNVDTALIFEDDLIFPSTNPRQDIIDAITRSKGFKMIYLGHCYSIHKKFSDPNTRLGTAQCLHGYVITREAIVKLLQMESSNYHIPVDKVTEKLCKSETCYISHHIEAKLKTYGIGIVHQDLGLGSDLTNKHVSFKGLRIT
jgi:GR25 family glycosyltransferase involved in LPS biosynthesis/phosphorylcholine metabolism protein LicD